MALRIETKDNKFRVITEVFSTHWLPDVIENRRVILIMLRWITKDGKKLFSENQLVPILGKSSALISRYTRKFRVSGENFYKFLYGKRKIQGEIEVEKKQGFFRVVGDEVCIDWLPENKANRKTVALVLRKIVDKEGTKLFTYPQLSKIVPDSQSLQEKFDEDGQNFLKFHCHKRQQALDIELEEHQGKFRVVTPYFSTTWLPSIEENKKTVLLMLRALEYQENISLFRFESLAKIVASNNQQAAHYYAREFLACSQNFLHFLTRKRKADEKIIQAVRELLAVDPLQSKNELLKNLKAKLHREDIATGCLNGALAQIDCNEIRRILQKRIKKGETHYKEEYVFQRLFELASENTEKTPELAFMEKELITSLRDNSLQASKPISSCTRQKRCRLTENAKLIFQEQAKKENLVSIWQTALGWKLWAFLLYFNGISTAVIGGWIGKDKSTICRWLDDVALWGNDYISQLRPAFSGIVSVDEKWIKIKNTWWFLFAAVDCVTGYPLHVALLPANDTDYCKLFLLELKNKGYYPKTIITDGWDPYLKALAKIFPKTEHLLCRFHVVRSVFRRLREARIYDKNIATSVGKLFQSLYKRTVERRITKLNKKLSALNLEHVLSGLKKKLPQVIKAIGSSWRPSTANSVERFFGAFDRFYRLKGPFQNQKSALKHINLFLLGYNFSVCANGKPCPLEKTGENVSSIPFYHLINRPNVLALRNRMVDQVQRQAG